MNYPSKVQVGAREIAVTVVDSPIVRTNGSLAVGKFEPLSNTITVYHKDSTPDICGEAFVHELCEAADVVYDLRLPHQTIQTLSAALYQAFSSGNVSFDKKVSNVGDCANSMAV